MGKNVTAAQGVALSRVRVAAERLRVSRAEAEEKVRQLVRDEVRERELVLKQEVQAASKAGLSNTAIALATGTSYRGKVIEMVKDIQAEPVGVQYIFDTTDIHKSTVTVAYFIDSTGARFDGPEVIEFNFGGYPSYDGDGALVSQMSVDTQIEFDAELKRLLGEELKNA